MPMNRKHLDKNLTLARGKRVATIREHDQRTGGTETSSRVCEATE